MSRRTGLTLALTAAAVLAPMQIAAQDASVRTVTATHSPALEARLVRHADIVRPGAAPGAPPAITGASGLARIGKWTFVAQDDSSLLAAMGDDGRIETVRVFDAIGGADRFHEALGNKKVKPDLEAITPIAIPRAAATALGGASAKEALLVVGSGSTPESRDRMAVVFPAPSLAASRVAAIRPRALYARMRTDTRLTGGGVLNIEAVAVVDRGKTVRFYNRGNGPAGSVTASVDVPAAALVDYLVKAKSNPDAPFDTPLSNPTRYELGTSNGVAVSIGDAIVVAGPKSSEMILGAFVAEATIDPNEDGVTSGTQVGLQLPDGTLLLAPVVGADGPSALKIEGLAVKKASWSKGRLTLDLTGVVDSDSKDPAVPSIVVELTVTYDPSKK